jgi:hypothetical protein
MNESAVNIRETHCSRSHRPGYLTGQLDGMRAWNPADFVACINLLRNKRFRGCDENNFALWEPAVN